MSGAISLPERLDIKGAKTLQADLLAAKGAVALDASKVEMLGAPGLQVLLAGKIHFEEHRHALAIEAPSAAFLECLKDLGATVEHIQVKGA